MMNGKTAVVVVCSMLAVAVMGLATPYFLIWFRDSYHSFDSLLEQFEAGAIAPGATTPFTECKPVAVVQRLDDASNHFWMITYFHNRHVLNVYEYNGRVYAAQHINARDPRIDRWYFCDMSLLERHIALATK